MRYASVCSGIGAPEVAWSHLGWECAWQAEIAPFPSAVLEHRFPGVPNLGDFTKIGADAGPLDLLVGGTPCQSFSVAGRRAGLDDPRGVLAFEFLRLAGRLLPRWVVFENVPGLLSSNGGRDFGAFLGSLGRLGYGWAYRVLDAQWFGVAQRRARVFVVGRLGDFRGPLAVLLEPSSLRGDPAPSREAGARVAASLTRGADSGGWRVGADEAAAGQIVPDTVHALTGRQERQDGTVETMIPFRKSRRAQTSEDDETWVPADAANTLNGFDVGERDTHAVVTPFSQNQREEVRDLGDKAGAVKSPGTHEATFLAFHVTQDPISGSVSPAMGTGNRQGCGTVGAAGPFGVRRLTPLECERLQGLPDGWTAVPYRGKPAKDGPRYQAIGNSMAVPVMAWIGKRIALVESL